MTNLAVIIRLILDDSGRVEGNDLNDSCDDGEAGDDYLGPSDGADGVSFQRVADDNEPFECECHHQPS